MTQDKLPFRMFFNPQGDLLESARDCEAEVFFNTYGNTRDQLDAEYGPYESASAFIALADNTDRVIGVTRLIAPSDQGLKVFQDIQSQPWGVDALRAQQAARIDPNRAWEFATLGVRKGMRGTGRLAALALYHGLMQAVQANNIGTVLGILDVRMRALLASISVETQVVPGTSSRPYLGSASSTPVYAHCPAVMDVQRRLDPEAHRLVCLGIGLDGVSVPPTAAFRLDRTKRTLSVVEPKSTSAINAA